jgi:hypothetical protein
MCIYLLLQEVLLYRLPSCRFKMFLVVPSHILVVGVLHTLGSVVNYLGGPDVRNRGPMCVSASSIFFLRKRSIRPIAGKEKILQNELTGTQTSFFQQFWW